MSETGKLAVVKVEVEEGAKRAWKWSTIRVGLLLSFLYAGLAWATPAVVELSNHWVEMAPFVLKYFPTADQAVGPFIGAVLTLAARLLVIRFPRKEAGS